VGRKPLIRVVVSEAIGPDATLAPIMTSEGFLVVGHAPDGPELPRLIAEARPDVVVFDAETRATTVVSARSWAPDAGIVVVWPFGVATPAADQQVDPSRVRDELAAAVRRAVPTTRKRAAALGVVPGASIATGRTQPSGESARSRRDPMPLLVAASIAALLLVSVAVALRNGPPSILAQGPGGSSIGTGGGDHQPGPALEPRPRVPGTLDRAPSSDPRGGAGTNGGNGTTSPPKKTANPPIPTEPKPGHQGQPHSPDGPGNSSGHGRSDEAHANGNAYGHGDHHGGRGNGNGKGHGDHHRGRGNGNGHDHSQDKGQGQSKGKGHASGHDGGRGHAH
jgi:hypothetical protein